LVVRFEKAVEQVYLQAVPKLNVKQFLAWADAHHESTGRWPGMQAGEIPGSGGETWRAVYLALRRGTRELPGGDVLRTLLARHGRRGD
jgi:hypothetical protein